MQNEVAQNPFQRIDNRFEGVENILAEILASVKQSKVVSQTIKYLSTKQVATFLDKTPNAIRVMVHKGQIKSLKQGNSLFFLESDIVDYLESGRRQNKTESILNCEEALVTRKRGN